MVSSGARGARKEGSWLPTTSTGIGRARSDECHILDETDSTRGGLSTTPICCEEPFVASWPRPVTGKL